MNDRHVVGFASKHVVASFRDVKCQLLGETLLHESKFRNRAIAGERHFGKETLKILGFVSKVLNRIGGILPPHRILAISGRYAYIRV
jgi:hypothetical protein